jgi:SAM-dependent methyltransferase
MNVKEYERTFLEPSFREFEQLYVDLRSNEQRIYSDEEVAWLPDVDEDHVHKKEWQIRKVSAEKLVQYLKHKKRPLKILEVGCGNGWLSCYLSQTHSWAVTGIDINWFELQQAQRVFAAIPNLRFVYGDIDSSLLEMEKFDVIIFAASIQYFPSFRDVVEKALKHTNGEGEVHILDSHLYSENEISEAGQRSAAYFHSKGYNKMSAFYFHHSLEELPCFNFSFLYNPHSVFNKLFKKKNPFYWIRIRT